MICKNTLFIVYHLNCVDSVISYLNGNFILCLILTGRQMHPSMEGSRHMPDPRSMPDPRNMPDPREAMYSQRPLPNQDRVSTSSDDKSREMSRLPPPGSKDPRHNEAGSPSLRPMHVDNRPLHRDDRSPHRDGRSLHGDNRPPQQHGGHRSPVGDRSLHPDHRLMHDGRALHRDNRPPHHGDHRPPVDDRSAPGGNPSKGPSPDNRRRENMQQDASAIFAALFEKDTQKAKPDGSGGSGGQEAQAKRPTLTAASLIDVIITRSINQPMLEAQEQGMDSDSNEYNMNRPSGSQERPSHSHSVEGQIPKEKEATGVASSSTGGGGSPNKPSEGAPARSEAETSNPSGNPGPKPTQSNTPGKPSRPITLAEHIDSIISLDYSHPAVGSSTSKINALSENAGSVDTTMRSQQEQGATSSMSATRRYHQKMAEDSEVGSTNDASGRRENSPMSNVHSSRAGSAEARSRSRAGTPGSSGSPDTGVIVDDKGNRGSTRQADTVGGQSKSQGDTKPDSHSNGSGMNRWTPPQFAGGNNPLRNPGVNEVSREASPISHNDISSPWARKYPIDSNKADSSESPSAGSLGRGGHVHSSQSNSPQTTDGWGMVDSNRPSSVGRRRESPETSTGLGSSSSSSNMHPDASSSGISAEGKKNYSDSSAVSSGMTDSKWRHGVMPDRSRAGMSKVESSRNSPVPQSSSSSASDIGSMQQPADSMSQVRQRMGASSSNRSPVAGNIMSSISGMRGMPPRKDNMISLDLRKSIDRMIESQVRVDEPPRRPTQVRVDDYVTQLFEADMSSSMSTPQRCDSRESTSTAESTPSVVQVDETKPDNNPDSRQEPVSQGLSTMRNSHEASSNPRQSSTETAETESPSPATSVSASDPAAGSAPQSSKAQDQRLAPRSVNAIGSSPSRRPEDSTQPSQSLMPSSSQQGFSPGPQYPYSALVYPYTSTASTMGHRLNSNPQRNIPSPRGPVVRGPSPTPSSGSGSGGNRDKETTQVLSNKYETLTDSD